LEPSKVKKNVLRLYSYLGWLIPVFKFFAPNSVCKLEDLGNAMINAVAKGSEKQILEVSDIVALPKK
jgi:hypothetical protein